MIGSKSLEADRFEFGENWSSFLEVIDEHRIEAAVQSLRTMLKSSDLSGKRFLDAGSGSGLFSLAAVRLGAELVHSFDFDPVSMASTEQLRRDFSVPRRRWRVEAGDIADPAYCAALGEFDIVYCWGVAHHTGSMWTSLENLDPLVGPRGHLFLSIYNDQGKRSELWRVLKRTYNRLPIPLRRPYAAIVVAPQEALGVARAVLAGQPMSYLRGWKQPKRRGMSKWHDVLDWVGGYPFEVAKPDAIVDFYLERNFALDRLRTVGGAAGCNQFVFRRMADAQ